MATTDTLDGPGHTDRASRLWVLHRNGHLASCYMMTSAVQTDIYMTYDGDRLNEMTFPSVASAYAWAEEDRRLLVALGWVGVADESQEATDYRAGINSPLPGNRRQF